MEHYEEDARHMGFMCLPNLVEGQSQFPCAPPMESNEAGIMLA
jgi:hypothetical protein